MVTYTNVVVQKFG